jgi:hypothetical protein
MEERIKLILPERDLERVDFSLTDVVTVDVHGLSLNKMIRLLKNITCICRQSFTLRIIHGFNHGTKLKDAVRMEGLFTRSYKIIPDQTNPGVTMLIFA